MLKKSKGFTLIELLVVIAIIGILAAVVISYLGQSRLKARDARRKSDLKEIQTALENFADDNNGTYPAATANLVPTYMGRIPTDPRTQAAYGYAVNAGTTAFEVNATLENANDNDDNNDGGDDAATYEVGSDMTLI